MRDGPQVLANEKKEPGGYSATWDASGVASGIYFYRLTVGGFVKSRKMIFVKQASTSIRPNWRASDCLWEPALLFQCERDEHQGIRGTCSIPCAACL